jgi:heat shock protein HslJ
MYRRFLLSGFIALATISVLPGFPIAAAQNPSSQPAAGPKAVPLKETHWSLIELDGDPVTAPNEQSQPYLYLHDEGDKLSGSGGCNRLFGSFDLSGDSLQFHSVASTRMACADNSMRYESDLLEALKLATSYTITGNVLALRVDDRILAKCRAEQQN